MLQNDRHGRSKKIFQTPLGLACLLLLAICTTGCGNNSQADTDQPPSASNGQQITNVAVSPLILQDLEERFTLPGTLEAWEDLTLAAEMAGPVRWIGPKEGDRVKQGEAILKIDPEQREAELTRDEVEFELQKKRMERRKALVDRNLVSLQEFEDAQKLFEQARAKLRLSQVALDKSTLKSPINAILDRLMVDRGEYVSQGTPVAVVMQVNRLKAIVDVPEKNILGLAPGQKARISTSPVGGDVTPVIDGEIIHLSFQADPATRTYRAKVSMDNSSNTLRPGMIIRVEFIREKLSQVIAVPLYALIDRGDTKVVFLENNGKALERKVKTGPIVGDLAVIEQGLSVGDRLIVKGQQLIDDGAPVVEEKRPGDPAYKTSPPANDGKTPAPGGKP